MIDIALSTRISKNTPPEIHHSIVLFIASYSIIKRINSIQNMSEVDAFLFSSGE